MLAALGTGARCAILLDLQGALRVPRQQAARTSLYWLSVETGRLAQRTLSCARCRHVDPGRRYANRARPQIVQVLHSVIKARPLGFSDLFHLHAHVCRYQKKFLLGQINFWESRRN